MTTPAHFQMSQGYTVLSPKSGEAYPIPCAEWDFLKNQIGELTDEPWFFQFTGSLLIGASVATFIAILTGSIAGGAERENALRNAWSIFVVSGVLGGFSLIFAYKERQVQKTKATSVIAQMNIIEGRYDKSAADALAKSSAEVVPTPYVIGERVRHKLFGSGRIEQITGTGADVKAVIAFDDPKVGRKTIKLKYTSLHREAP